jgi:hypothetical protein
MDERLALRYEFRDEMTEAVRLDLLGPSEVDEVISDPPITHYLMGILHPRDPDREPVAVDAFGIGGGALDEGQEDVDEPMSTANSRYPSSMGLTFAVEGADSGVLTVALSAARYTDVGHGWLRSALTIEPVELCIDAPDTGSRRTVADGLDLFVRVRPADDDGRVSATLALINTLATDGARQSRDIAAFLQPSIAITLPVESPLRFVDRSKLAGGVADDDLMAARLLFRHVQNLAVGHGCAVRWDPSNEPRSIETTFMPVHDLLLSDSNPDIDAWVLDMRAPAQRSRPEIVDGLRDLVRGYESWIDDQRSIAGSLDDELRAQARKHLDECSVAASRMHRGISLLSAQDDDRPFLAFVLMSEAMVEQRVRSERVLAGRTDVATEDIRAAWRPFQLAFVLMCLEGLIDESSDDREVADLLWFPTGGGKTEAYLGLIAFTIFLRRLCQKPDGVVALMRYTLRLLTAQQFERAALLMCCCESIRRRRHDLGTRWIEVGLFVGRAASPLTVKDAKKALDLLAGNPEADTSKTGNPMQVGICVWCGTRLGVEDHKVLAHPDRCIVRCPNTACDFKERLPWWVVDEDLYRERPSLVIGTVDKFASLAWREAAGNLFNRGVDQEPGIDLIIQDELHLISGPLGTVTGLYETAVDELASSRTGVRPKVIASTATIRRATEQVRAVFDREVAQFPPPATDARNSYFAVEAPADRRGTRRYVGVMAPGTSQATVLVRTYARLFHEPTRGERGDELRDTYWTLVGYFNSLRVLAGAQLQVLDDVDDRLGVIDGNGDGIERTPGEHLVELTSRESSASITNSLRTLRLPYGVPGCQDVVLATNMISVGVDVDRLGLMVVAGQPQATAEYIQATSRVGRRDPGLVFVMYNAARSRDRSHYESFQPYHSMLYRQVEATSATPFSPRARDRALHAVLVALARHTIPALASNADAAAVRSHRTAVDAIIDRIVARAERVDESVDGTVIRQELTGFLDDWATRAEAGPLFYESRKHPESALLVAADQLLGDAGEQGASPTLWSMRDVDRTSTLYEIGAR